MTIYSTIITLRTTRGHGTITTQEKTDNKVRELQLPQRSIV